MLDHDDIAAFLRGWLPSVPGLRQQPGGPWLHRSLYVEAPPTAEELAEELIRMTEFRALRLGTWLGTKDGQIVAKAVGVVVPPVFRPQYELVVDALMLAADLQRQHGERVAGAVALGALGFGAILVAAAGNRAA